MRQLPNLAIGTGGTLIAWIEKAPGPAAFAGYATGIWMIIQSLGYLYDRWKKRHAFKK